MTFDPNKHLMKLKGKDYLPVAARLTWFRDEWPCGVIDTEALVLTDDKAVFRATVHKVDADGVVKGTATGTKSETPKGFADYIEKAECLPLTVPILTRDGWRFFYQVRPGDEALGYDVVTKKLTWTVVRKVSTFDRSPLVQIGNSRFSAVCTPDHKWVLNGSLVPWNERHGSGTEKITLAAPVDERGGDPHEAARLGWLMTDAEMTYTNGLPTRAEVRQSKPENFDHLDGLFGSAQSERSQPDRSWPNGSVSTVQPLRAWSVPARQVRETLGRFRVATRSDLPVAVLRMTYDEAAAFVDAAMRADGWKGSSAAFGKTSLPVIEAVQLAALLTGRSSGVIKERSGNGMTTKPCYTVGLHKGGEKYTSEFATKPLPPQQVWCPTTETGTWVANFNGFIGITGNTGSIGRALAALGFGTQFAPEFDEGERIVDSPQPARSRPQPAPPSEDSVAAMREIHAVAKNAGVSHAMLHQWAVQAVQVESLKDVSVRTLKGLSGKLQDPATIEQFIAKYGGATGQSTIDGLDDLHAQIDRQQAAERARQ